MTKDNTYESEDYLLIIATQQGNKEAFSKLYDKYAPLLMGFLRGIVPSQIKAEEILQTTFLQIWNKIGSFEASKNSFFTWLLIITRQTAFGNVSLSPIKNQLHGNTVYLMANNKEQHSQATVQQVFELVFYKGLSCEAAAAVLKMPIEDIRKNIRLAIKNINAIKVL